MINLAYRRAIIPGFETLLKRRKTYSFWKELEQSQWWSREELEQWQLERLKELLGYCDRNSTYYHDAWSALGLSLRSLTSLADFCQWPITSRETMRDRVADIRVNDPNLKVVSKSTGGSSGTPLCFVIDGDANDRRVAASHRGYDWAGAAPGRVNHFCGESTYGPSLVGTDGKNSSTHDVSIAAMSSTALDCRKTRFRNTSRGSTDFAPKSWWPTPIRCTD